MMNLMRGLRTAYRRDMELLQLSEARTYRILAIDDDPTCTELTRLALEGAGSYVVREVNDLIRRAKDAGKALRLPQSPARCAFSF